MHVIVVGCGRVGSGLAVNLTAAGHTVAVIDRLPAAFSRLGPGFTGQVVTGIGFDRDRLAEAGIDRADALAAVTNGDNSNIVVARVAREHYGIERVVARIYDPRRAAVYQRLGIQTVATVAWTIERITRKLVPDEPGVEWIDPTAKVTLVERTVGAGWAGHPYTELEADGAARLVAITRLGTTQLPTPRLVAQEGDLAFLATTDLASVEALLAGPREASHA